MVLTEVVNLVVPDRDLQIEISVKVDQVSGYTNHDYIGEEDDDREKVEGMVDRQGPVTKIRRFIASVNALQVENVLK